MSRRTSIILCAVALVAAGALVVAGLLHTGVPIRDRGQLAQAVVNATQDQGSASDRIATDPAHAAIVTETQVDWFTQSGQEFVTQTTSSAPTLQLFDANHYYNYTADTGPSAGAVLMTVVPALATIALVFILIRFLRKGMPGMSMRQNGAKQILGESTGVTFADVAGCPEAVVELEEIVSILKHPARFARLGARTPRGVVLAGPPGTGKTLLAKAVAGEAGVPFFAASGSEFVEMFVGVGAARVRDLFKEARLRAPSIVFMDEIDALGKRRSTVSGHGNEEREQTLNQLLVELDGINSTAPVIVIVATNRPDVLDPALLRPGRFDRNVTVDLPDLKGREQILAVHARNKPLEVGTDLAVVARQTPGFSGADLANVINEATLLAARRDASSVSSKDLEDACLRVMAGPERQNKLLSERERELVAFHEMGHALVGHTLPFADPVHKVSIVSRGRALGFTMQLPERDQVLVSRNQFTDKLAGLLGGRMAEELVYGPDEITSGAADDIERATRIATRMVTELGMSPLGLRQFGVQEPGQPRAWSEQTAHAIDIEVERLLDEAYARAREVLSERRDLLDALAARLLETETIEADELNAIIDRYPRRGVPRARVISLPRRHLVQPSEDAPAAAAAAAPIASVAVNARARRRMVRRTTLALLRFTGLVSPTKG